MKISKKITGQVVDDTILYQKSQLVFLLENVRDKVAEELKRRKYWVLTSTLEGRKVESVLGVSKVYLITPILEGG